MNKLVLSIVIPTKNRQKYCIGAVKQILSLNLKNIEICIQDNSDTAELKEIFTKKEYKDIVVYNYLPGILSFVDNFSHAVALCKGKYICMIGDDDGIMPDIMHAVHYADEMHIIGRQICH